MQGIHNTSDEKIRPVSAAMDKEERAVMQRKHNKVTGGRMVLNGKSGVRMRRVDKSGVRCSRIERLTSDGVQEDKDKGQGLHVTRSRSALLIPFASCRLFSFPPGEIGSTQPTTFAAMAPIRSAMFARRRSSLSLCEC